MILSRVVSSLNGAFVWNYLEAFTRSTYNVKIVASFFLLDENASPQIQSSYKAIERSGGRRSDRRFLCLALRARGRSRLPDADRPRAAATSTTASSLLIRIPPPPVRSPGRF